MNLEEENESLKQIISEELDVLSDMGMNTPYSLN